VTTPTFDDIRHAVTSLGITVSDDTLRQLEPFVSGMVASAAAAGGDDPASAPADRDPGRPPDAAENPLGAWYWRCSVRESSTGPLAGRTLALKDNIASPASR